ncbi:MAG: phosphoribosylformylglycinamidine synthase subunit PurQ, partial [Chloroflexota bacterium]|nr:phosphoribosylformylglycinamidine synthase subunit PurQ [Chloroflexota bacterium]
EWVCCRVERTDSPFLAAGHLGQVLRLPIAHGEGNFVPPAGTDPLVALRYCDAAGRVTAAANPNGARDNVAAIQSSGGNVFGLMPHPERANEPLLGSVDGQVIFESLALAVRRPALV